MATYEEVYQTVLNQTLELNQLSLKLSIDNDVKEKLVSWSKRHNTPYNLTKYAFNNDETFRLNFIKDPKKQNIASTSFVKFIELNCGIGSIEMLPNGGAGALYCLGGKVLPFTDIKNVRKNAKTIDFIMKTKDNKCIYISHKRTDGSSGGAQDNQKNDAEAFLEQVRNNNDASQVFVAVLDGDYYISRIPKIRSNFYRENKIYVGNSDELVNIIIPTLNSIG